MIICLDGNKIHYRNQKIVYQRELPPSRQQYNLLPVSKTNSDAPFSIRESPPKKNHTKSGIVLQMQSHFYPNQEFKCYFKEKGRSIIPILETNAHKCIKYFHGNSARLR